MKKESIIVVYDYNQTVAEEISDMLGAEITSAQALTHRMADNAHSYVLVMTLQEDGNLLPFWHYGLETLLNGNLSGKAFAFIVCGSDTDESCMAINHFCEDIRDRGASVVGQVFYTDSHLRNLDDWIASVSPGL